MCNRCQQQLNGGLCLFVFMSVRLSHLLPVHRMLSGVFLLYFAGAYICLSQTLNLLLVSRLSFFGGRECHFHRIVNQLLLITGIAKDIPGPIRATLDQKMRFKLTLQTDLGNAALQATRSRHSREKIIVNSQVMVSDFNYVMAFRTTLPCSCFRYRRMRAGRVLSARSVLQY